MRFLIPVALAFSLLGAGAMAAPKAPPTQSAAQATAPTTKSTAMPAVAKTTTVKTTTVKTASAPASMKPAAVLPAKDSAAPAATRCRDAKGHFTACTTTAKNKTCRDANGRFASCKS